MPEIAGRPDDGQVKAPLHQANLRFDGRDQSRRRRNPTRRSGRAAGGPAVDERPRRRDGRVRHPGQVRTQGDPRVHPLAAWHHGQRRFAHAAGVARRDGHAQRATLRAAPQRRARHRPRPASAPHPRPGEAPADLHRGRAPALSDDLPDPLPRVLRQQRGCSTSRRRRISPPGRRTGSCRAASGPACRCACCSRKPVSTGARRGCSPRAGTPPR